MKNKLTFVLVVFILVTLSGHAQNLSATDIVKKADDKTRGLSSQGEMTMTIVRTGWQRSLTMKYWSKGTTHAIIYISAPAKDKGQVFLKIKNEMWNWQPKIQRMIKIPGSMMMQSWMGSDFTNDDLVKESSIVTDYTHKLLGSEVVREMDCYKIELVPNESATVVWGKVILWITKTGFHMWKTDYYDEDGVLVNTENAYNIKKMGDREIPTRMEIIPQEKEKHGQKTILEITVMLFNIKVDDDFFTQQNMKQVK
jgi:outer membrane lipoprotein-sorting protein